LASTAITFIVAGVLALGLTPLARWLALRYGVVSVPNSRSVHTRPVPYLGGVPIYLAFVAAAAYGLGVRHELVRVLALGGGVIMLLGAIDDIRPLSPRTKLAVEFVVAALTVAAGVQIEWVTNPLGGMIILGAWGIPLTMLWLVAVTNVLNWIDGLDGLAAGITAIVGLTLFFACRQAGQVHSALLTAALAGAALGFLPHNFNPAKIFMGDAGALFLGFAVAVISVEGPIKSAATVAMFVPILALGVPILDAVFALWRRMVNRRPLAMADRGHLHHRLLNLGLTQRQAVLLMYSVSGFFGASAIKLAELSAVEAALLLAAIFSGVLIAARGAGLLGLGDTSRSDLGQSGAAAGMAAIGAAAAESAATSETPSARSSGPMPESQRHLSH